MKKAPQILGFWVTQLSRKILQNDFKLSLGLNFGRNPSALCGYWTPKISAANSIKKIATGHKGQGFWCGLIKKQQQQVC